MKTVQFLLPVENLLHAFLGPSKSKGLSLFTLSHKACSRMNEIERNQLDTLNQKVVNGEELNDLQRQLRSELSALLLGA